MPGMVPTQFKIFEIFPRRAFILPLFAAKRGPPPHPYVDSLFFGLLKLLTLIQRLYEPDFRLKQHFLLHFLLFGAFFIF
jgi:hypothetical protein